MLQLEAERLQAQLQDHSQLNPLRESIANLNHQVECAAAARCAFRSPRSLTGQPEQPAQLASKHQSVREGLGVELDAARQPASPSVASSEQKTMHMHKADTSTRSETTEARSPNARGSHPATHATTRDLIEAQYEPARGEHNSPQHGEVIMTLQILNRPSAYTECMCMV